MNTKTMVNDSVSKRGTELLATSLPILSRSKSLRQVSFASVKTYIQIFQSDTKNNSLPRPIGMNEDRSEFSKVIWETADRILTHDLSRSVLKNVSRNLVNGIMINGGDQSAISQFHETYGTNPPGFLTVSPGKACNLHCTGCYANAGADAEKLDWNTREERIEPSNPIRLN